MSISVTERVNESDATSFFVAAIEVSITVESKKAKPVNRNDSTTGSCSLYDSERRGGHYGRKSWNDARINLWICPITMIYRATQRGMEWKSQLSQRLCQSNLMFYCTKYHQPNVLLLQVSSTKPIYIGYNQMPSKRQVRVIYPYDRTPIQNHNCLLTSMEFKGNQLWSQDFSSRLSLFWGHKVIGTRAQGHTEDIFLGVIT